MNGGERAGDERGKGKNGHSKALVKGTKQERKRKTKHER